MTYNYMTVANEILGHFGETRLTATTFTTVEDPFQLHILEKINTAILDIYTENKSELPFAKTVGTEVLVAGTQEYSRPANHAVIDWDSFYISYNALLTTSPYASNLTAIDYDQYRVNQRTVDLNSVDSDNYSRPRTVVRTQGTTYIVSPKPDLAYTLKYEYFTLPTTLTLYSDIPDIPERYRAVIIQKVLIDAYRFKGDADMSQIAAQDYRKTHSSMRRELIRYDTNLKGI